MAKAKTKVKDEGFSMQSVKAMTWEDAIAQDDGESIWRAESDALASAATIMSWLYSEDWVFITADLLASEFASPWPRVMKQEIVDGRMTGVPAEGHPLQTLLDDPTLYGGAQAFWYRAGIFDAMLGNCFIWYMRANNKMMLIPAHEVRIEFDTKTRLPCRYVWQTGDVNAGISTGTAFPVEEVCHVMRPNPASMWWGLSPFVPGRRAILFNRYSEEFLNTFFERGATPQMIVETEISNSPEAIKTLAKSFELVSSGRKNARRPLVLPKGAKVTQVSMTLADTQLKEFIEQNREVILNLLRIPKHALGLQTSGSLGSEEHKTALRYMWTATVKPMLKRFATGLTKFFQRQGILEANYYIDFDSSEIEVASEDMARKSDLSVKLLNTHTINEVRQILWESEPVEGGDVILSLIKTQQQPFQYGQSLNFPSQQTIQTQQQAVPVGGEDTDLGEGKQKYAHIGKILDSQGFKDAQYKVDSDVEATGDKLEKMISELLLSQLSTSLKVVKEFLGQKETPDLDALLAEILANLLSSQEQFKKDYLGVLSNTLDVGYDSQVEMVFDPKDRGALAELSAETAKGRKAILAKRSIDTFAGISRTTTDKIVEVVAKGSEDGLTLAQIAQSIGDAFAQIVPSRARTISRTETLTAVSIGQDSAIKNAARVMPKAQKVWITQMDGRARDSHEDMHEDVVGIKQKFNVRGVRMSVPRDPNATGEAKRVASECINCRCTTVIVSPEDKPLLGL